MFIYSSKKFTPVGTYEGNYACLTSSLPNNWHVVNDQCICVTLRAAKTEDTDLEAHAV